MWMFIVLDTCVFAGLKVLGNCFETEPLLCSFA